MTKSVIDLKIVFIVLYFKKLILNLPYNYQKYPAPNALIYSNMSVVVVEGFGSLPD